MADVIMPKMGDAMEEGTLLRWTKRDGEAVTAGDIIAEIETDKSNVELDADESGVLQIKTQEGQTVPVGSVIAVIGNGRSSDAGVSAGNGRHPESAATEVHEAPPANVNGSGHTLPAAVSENMETVNVTYADAIRMALEEELDRDESVFMLGEEIGQYQGTFKITRDFLDRYGPERIVDTPISESGMVGMTVGSAMMGMRPIIEFMTLNFALVAWDQIINHAAKIMYMSGGQYSVPCVLRGPSGVGVQLSAQHSQDLAHWYANTPGLKVVAPATAADAKGLLKSAVRDNNPVVFTEHAGLYRTKGDVPIDKDFLVPLGVADIKRTGRDVTIVSYSRGTILSLSAAELLAQQGIEAEIVDLRSLMPFDIDTVINSVKKTHRAVIVQEQWPFYGLAAEFAAQIAEKAFDYLDAPVERVAGAFVPMPYSRTLELLATPHEEQIVSAVQRTLARSL